MKKYRQNRRNVEVTSVERAHSPPCWALNLVRFAVNLGFGQGSDYAQPQRLWRIITGICLLLACEFLANLRMSALSASSIVTKIALRVTLRDVTVTKLARQPFLGSAGSGRFLRKEVFCD